MITEQEFLQALGIIKSYQNQINNQVQEIYKPKEVKRNDVIIITKTTGLSRLIKIGKEYRVVSCEIYANDYREFDKYFQNKYPDLFDNVTWEEYYKIYKSEIKNVDHYFRIKIDLGKCHYADFTTSSGYEYEIVNPLSATVNHPNP